MSTKLAAPLHESVGPILAEFDARQITSRIRQWVKAFPADDVKRAFFGRIWLAMGYDSWAEWSDSKPGRVQVAEGGAAGDCLRFA
jgi:hypothetical protein